MKREDIIQKMKRIDLPTDQYWILAGSGLVMHEIRSTTRDIDIGCTTELFDRLAKDPGNLLTIRDGQRALEVGQDLEVFENWLVDEIVMIEDLPVASLESIRKHKVQLGRPKDLEDIVMIDQRLKQRPDR